MATDDLVMQGDRASTDIELTYFSWNILVPAPEGMIFIVFFSTVNATTSEF